MTNDNKAKFFDAYWDFILNILQEGIDEDINEYSYLLSYLHFEEFYSQVPNDYNREEDGKQLRRLCEKMTKTKNLDIVLSGSCSVLEMLLGLAFRMEYELVDIENGMTASQCFWHFITNLGLRGFDNDTYISVDGDRILKTMITSWMDRRYNYNGEGGIFPLRNPKGDQTKIELWYQMCAYLLENFEF